jgi:hypothetical protein
MLARDCKLVHSKVFPRKQPSLQVRLHLQAAYPPTYYESYRNLSALCGLRPPTCWKHTAAHPEAIPLPTTPQSTPDVFAQLG